MNVTVEGLRSGQKRIVDVRSLDAVVADFLGPVHVIPSPPAAPDLFTQVLRAMDLSRARVSVLPPITREIDRRVDLQAGLGGERRQVDSTGEISRVASGGAHLERTDHSIGTQAGVMIEGQVGQSQVKCAQKTGVLDQIVSLGMRVGLFGCAEDREAGVRAEGGASAYLWGKQEQQVTRTVATETRGGQPVRQLVQEQRATQGNVNGCIEAGPFGKAEANVPGYGPVNVSHGGRFQRYTFDNGITETHNQTWLGRLLHGDPMEGRGLMTGEYYPKSK
jgi:hypothetical protein